MKKRILLGLTTLALVAAAWAGWRWTTVWHLIESTDDAYVEGDITALSPKIAGIVVAVAVGDNQTVKAGEVLVRLDDRDTRAKAAQARAVVTARRAALAQLDDRMAVQHALMAQAGAVITAAQADLTRSRADLDRARRLVKDDFLSRQRYDIHAADAAKAEAGVRGSGAQATAIKRQLAVLEADRAVATAQLAEAEAQAEQTQADLDATIIRAPVDGVIGNRVVRPGSYARTGQYLLSVVPLNNVWVVANFKETQLGRMQPGQRVEIAVDAFPDRMIEGRLASFAPASGAKFSLLPPENATGNFTKVVQRVPVRIDLPADHALAGRLMPGLSVVARVHTGSNAP